MASASPGGISRHSARLLPPVEAWARCQRLNAFSSVLGADRVPGHGGHLRQGLAGNDGSPRPRWTASARPLLCCIAAPQRALSGRPLQQERSRISSCPPVSCAIDTTHEWLLLRGATVALLQVTIVLTGLAALIQLWCIDPCDAPASLCTAVSAEVYRATALANWRDASALFPASCGAYAQRTHGSKRVAC